MTEVILKKSAKPDKKYDAIINGKTVSFGQENASDFTQHKDEKRKQNYIARHGNGNQDWNDYTTSGFWSRWISWEKPTLKEAVANVNKKFPNPRVKLKI